MEINFIHDNALLTLEKINIVSRKREQNICCNIF